MIHPIAGRCKHCKLDLAAARGARPQAAASLPSLAKGGKSPMVAVTSAASAKPSAVSFDRGTDDQGESILPPRQSARFPAVRESDGAPWYKSWPVIVIVLASVAIVAAIVLLVIPDKKDDNHLIDPPGPAPDRMNTNPLTEPHSQIDPPKPDPWGSGSSADPGANNGATPQRPPPPTAVPPPDPDDDNDVFGGIMGGTPGSGAGGPMALPNGLGGIAGLARLGAKAIPLASGMITHACARLKTCGSDDLSSMVCDSLSTVLQAQHITPPTCAAATKCFENVDAMSCDDVNASGDPLALVQPLMKSMQDCMDAIRC